jgi:hypothetical protein
VNDDPIYLVSETPDGPVMPFAALAALQKARIQQQVSAFLDAQGVPQDHALRAKAARLTGAAMDEILEHDLERMRITHGRAEWNARKRRR